MVRGRSTNEPGPAEYLTWFPKAVCQSAQVDVRGAQDGAGAKEPPPIHRHCETFMLDWGSREGTALKRRILRPRPGAIVLHLGSRTRSVIISVVIRRAS